MKLIRGKMGIFLLILCLGVVLAAVWYGLFGLSGKNKEIDGTLVNGIPTVKEEEMIQI